jgi:glyoxylase-like metal-dependent hydrolase (beta-lactamase superfamily II)
MKINKLMDGIYYSNADETTDRPILMFIQGEEKSLLIDSGNSPKHAEDFVESLREINAFDIDYVAITHWHWDHTFGLKYFEDSTIIANSETKKELDKMKDYKWDDVSLDERVKEGIEIEFCSSMIKEEFKDNREDIKIITPNIVFDKYVEVDLGGVTVQITKTENDHTTDGNIIFIKEKGVLFLGDITAPDLYQKNWVYTPSKFLNLMNTTRDYNAEIIVEAHDKPNTPEDFYKDYEATEIIAKLVEKGIRKVDEIKEKSKELLNRDLKDYEEEDIQFFLNSK